MNLNEKFGKAVEEEKFREGFSEAIADEGLPKYVSELTYNPVQTEDGKNEVLMRTCPDVMVSLYVKGKESR